MTPAEYVRLCEDLAAKRNAYELALARVVVAERDPSLKDRISSIRFTDEYLARQ